ncbi:MAG: hypothetical protein ISS72_06435 [Candidatus Brocadiae bacterium]|nr:hypothetical protein [Candidatus Brocadiia bacterium]
MGLPGSDSAVGKVAYGAGALVLIAVCSWQVTRAVRPPSPTAIPCLVVCDACGELEMDCPVPVRRGRGIELPVTCSKCGKKAVYLCYNCPSCGKALPVDPARPPAQCKHCGADTAGPFKPLTPGP